MMTLTETLWGMCATPDAVRNGPTLLRGFNQFGDENWHESEVNRDIGFILLDIPEPVVAFAIYVAGAIFFFKLIFR